MHRKDAIAWVVSVCAVSLRLSQAKTLSILVGSAMRVERISLANIGRAMSGLVKHQIKRCWRFCANDRIETADAMSGVLQRLLKKRRKKLVISLDWTDIKSFQTLVASIVFKGRSLPICWASCRKNVYEGHRSRNSFEESLLLILRGMIPTQVKIILLADRGFGRCELARFCRKHGLSYIIRIKANVCVRSAEFTGKLIDYPVEKGICKLLTQVAYRRHHSLRQNIVIRWVRGLPKHRDACWFLMTDLQADPEAISKLYGQRMTIEELFRDLKNKRNGWSLRDTKITRPERLDRLLLILAIAYLLLCGLGLVALQTGKPSDWSSSPCNQCSVFTIGRTMLRRLKTTVPRTLHALIMATEEVTQNWG